TAKGLPLRLYNSAEDVFYRFSVHRELPPVEALHSLPERKFGQVLLLSIFMAALISLSIDIPHLLQTYVLSESGMS
ncbi:MAG: hypothetical protein QXH93_05115, partial [Conexivisphaerales archaeon]